MKHFLKWRNIFCLSTLKMFIMLSCYLYCTITDISHHLWSNMIIIIILVLQSKMCTIVWLHNTSIKTYKSYLEHTYNLSFGLSVYYQSNQCQSIKCCQIFITIRPNLWLHIFFLQCNNINNAFKCKFRN